MPDNTANERLETLYKQWKPSLKRLFEDDPQRADKFWLEAAGITLDYSKNHITSQVMHTLDQLTIEKRLPESIADLFSGKHVNGTEDRPALHTALRAPSNTQAYSNEIDQCLEKVQALTEALHSQEHTGYSDKAITDVVNIGIGGSDLGPRMVTEALKSYHQPQIRVHFVANVDGADIVDTLDSLSPDTTLFIIASKSFTTLETLANAHCAKQWLLDSGCSESNLPKHLVAVSTNNDAAEAFGIHKDNIFPMWDWVGGRYSLWSAIGLPIAIAIGMTHFRALLSGAHEMDIHFQRAPTKENLPIIMALLTYWYSVYHGASSQAILPYAQRLSKFPAFLQQLDMESLGKSVATNGAPIEHSGIALWGTEGTNGQHSYHQLLHQGNQLIPVDFIAIKTPMTDNHHQHQLLLSCCISQAQALLNGKTEADALNELLKRGVEETKAKLLAKHKSIKGNKPSNTLVVDTLDPYHLGSLIALYEHKVYSLGILYNLNPFDQWGVELGKQLGGAILEGLKSGHAQPGWDQSTQKLVDKLSKKTE